MKMHNIRDVGRLLSTGVLVVTISACGAGTESDADQSASEEASNESSAAAFAASGGVSANVDSSSAIDLVVDTSDSVDAASGDTSSSVIVSTGSSSNASTSEAIDAASAEISASNLAQALGGTESDTSEPPVEAANPSVDTQTATDQVDEAATDTVSAEEVAAQVATEKRSIQEEQEAAEAVTETPPAESGSDSDNSAATDENTVTDEELAEQQAWVAAEELRIQQEEKEAAEAEATGQAEAEATAQAEAEAAAQAEAEAAAQAEAEAAAQAEAEAAAQSENSLVFDGGMENGEYLGNVECVVVSDNNQDFGQVDSSDWRNWFENYTYAQLPEYLSTGNDGVKSYIRQKLVPTSYGSHHVQAGTNLTSARTYRITQSLYFEPDFDWGGSNEGGKVGYGLGGGSTPSGGQIQTDGFTLRFMWRGNKDGTARMSAYSYAADRDQNYIWGEDLYLQGFEIPIGEWFDITMEVKTNSSTGTSDGSLRAWVDGDLKLQEDDIGWQLSGSRPAVQKLTFTTFYGGNDSSWAPSQTTYIRYADACWAPVVNASGDLMDDAAQSPLELSPTVLLDDAVLTVRGRVINALSSVEILMPIESQAVSTTIYAALDKMNEGLDDTPWTDNNSVPLGSSAILDLTSAAQSLSATASQAEVVPYVAEQTTLNAEVLLDAARYLGNVAWSQVASLLVSNGCNISTAAVCITANSHLDQAEQNLDASMDFLLTVSARGRLINAAWADINLAAGSR